MVVVVTVEDNKENIEIVVSTKVSIIVCEPAVLVRIVSPGRRFTVCGAKLVSEVKAFVATLGDV